jgi:hypothetical protein
MISYGFPVLDQSPKVKAAQHLRLGALRFVTHAQRLADLGERRIVARLVPDKPGPARTGDRQRSRCSSFLSQPRCLDMEARWFR